MEKKKQKKNKIFVVKNKYLNFFIKKRKNHKIKMAKKTRQ